MQVRYFYETDCYNLNKKARLFCPLSHRIADVVEKVLPLILPISRSFLPKQKMYPGEDGEIMEQITAKLNQLQKEIDWTQDIHKASYVVFDTETTGLQPLRGDRVISLGGVIIEEGEIQKKAVFEELVNPLRAIPPTATDITGINNALVSGKPTFLQVLNRFLDFIGSRILVAHYAAFDLAFLNMELCRISPRRIVNPVIDTYLLAGSLYPEMLEYSLESLAEEFNLQITGRHTALGDSMITAQIFLKLLAELKARGINTLEEVARYIYFQKTNAEYVSEKY